MNRRFVRSVYSIFVILIFSAVCVAQENPNLANGLTPYGSYHGGDIDSVSVINGGLTVHAPLASYPQRGSLKLDYYLVSGSKNWSVTYYNPNPVNANDGYYMWTSKEGSFTPYGVYLENTLNYQVQRQRELDQSAGGNSITTYGYMIITPDGSQHRVWGTNNQPFNEGTATNTWRTVDGTGLTMTEVLSSSTAHPEDSMTIVDRDGNRYSLVPAGSIQNSQKCETNPTNGVNEDCFTYYTDLLQTTSVTDVDGNTMQLGRGATDTLGRAIMNAGQAGAATCSGVPTTPFNVPTFGGGTGNITVCDTPLNLQTAFNQTTPVKIAEATIPDPADPYIQQWNYQPLAISSVTLQNTTSWNFQYDSYGNVINITLPTGGQISYTWQTIPLNCADGTYTQVSRAVSTRTVSGLGITTGTWTYTFGALQSNGTMTNVVTDPAGNDTVHVVSAIGGTGSCSYYETQTVYYQGPQSANHVLKTVNTAYSSSPANGFSYPDGGAYAYNVYPQTITTVEPNGLTKQTVTMQDSGITVNGVSLILGSEVSRQEYDYGQGSPGALIRQTVDTYAWQQSPAYFAANILDAKTSEAVEDAVGNRCSETDYTYDEAAYLQPSGLGTANQHGAAPNPVRGNGTTLTHWLAPLAPSTSSCQLQAGSSWSNFSTHQSWYDTGEIYQDIDALGNTTTYSYDPTYWGAYRTETTNALGQIVSGTYDFGTGLITSVTDANGSYTASGNTEGDPAHTSTYIYDNENRIKQASFPDGGNTGFQYDDTPGSLNEQETQLQIAPSTFVTNTVSFDGLGRKTQSAMLDPEGTDTTGMVYDSLGRVSKQYNPTRNFSSSTPSVQTQFDALGRVTFITKQDGSTITSSYDSNCTTVTDEAGFTRRSCVDGLGRIIEADEPGGTTGFPAYGDVAVKAVNGSGLQTIMAGANPGSAASGTIAVSGENTTNDLGTLTIQVGSTAATISYGYLLTAQTIAQNVATYFNQNSTQVNAVASQVTDALHWQIKFTAKQVGTAGNSLAITTSHTSFYGTEYPFAYTFSPASGSLSGGVNTVTGTPVTDYGTVTASLNGSALTVCYGPNPNASCNGVNNSTTAQVAAALMAPYQNSPWWGTGVVQSSAASTMFLVYAKNNTATNNGTVTITSTTAFPQYFPQGSFNGGGTLSGGLNPSPASINTPLVTLYQYDPLGNLICVEQHGDAVGTGCSSVPSNDATSPWRVRRLQYDSMARLLQATNPESGKVTYKYDNNGNLTSKTDARGITISYGPFDKLNRVLGKTYSDDEAPVTYSYDSGMNGIGHRTGMTDAAGSSTWGYDLMGRVSSDQRITNGIQQSIGYKYYPDGELETLQYPSGDALTLTPSYAGRVLSIADTANGISYLSGATYTPDGQPSGYVNGKSGNFAGIGNSFVYNSRLQLANASAVSPTQTLFNLSYDLHVGNGDNGNVWAITNNKDATGNRNQTFTFDALNRLSSAQNAGTDCTVMLSNGLTEYWGSNYTYDAWGNLLSKTPTKCSSETLSQSVTGENQFSGNGAGYDAAGNMTAYGGVSYSYNAEGQLSGSSGYSYVYDGDGNRVAKIGAKTVLYWHGSHGVLAETDASGEPLHEYVFYGDTRIARRDGAGQTYGAPYYYFSNHLSSTSVIADANGNIQAESDYYGWGGELPINSSLSFSHKFTGKERDQETGLDHMGSRYYMNSVGRFMRPDPLSLEMHRLGDPQQLNLYMYGRENPLKFTDPTGLDITCDGTRCNDYLANLQKDVSVTLSFDKNGTVVVSSKTDENGLSKKDKQFLKAIKDTKHHVMIHAVDGAKDGTIFLGRSDGDHTGSHTIAFGQLSLLDSSKNVGGITPAAVVGHETLEGYAESTGESLDQAHKFANFYSPMGDHTPTWQREYRSGGNVVGLAGKIDFGPVTNTITEHVVFQFSTPVPQADFDKGAGAPYKGFPVEFSTTTK